MRRTWTEAHISLLKEKYPISTPDELKEMFLDHTYPAIKSKAKFLNLKKAIQRFHFSFDQIIELKQIYHNTQNRELAKRYGCSIHTIDSRGFKLSLKKDKEFIAKMARIEMEDPNHPARKFWIKKGNIPINKGLKLDEYLTPEQIEVVKTTWFKKGHSPVNQKPIGWESIRDGYIYVKVSEPNKFDSKQRIVWKENFGKIPKGWNVQFKDANPLNCDPENLYIISRSDQLKNENSFFAKYPIEIQNLIHAKGALTRQINKINQNQTI